MALLLGIDTGGTYTDAVLFDDAEMSVIASAKSLTSKHDLSICVGKATSAVLGKVDADARDRIALVSLSTTLATNAIVEQHGFPIGLVMIGQPKTALDRAGLRNALGSDPALFIDGGHRTDGTEQAALDEAALRDGLVRLKGKASAFAVCGYFAVRNPNHEARARDIIREATGLPVTCGHELSSGLDAPRRALTALLNARLIPLLQQLIQAVDGMLTDRGIEAPLMVVKGDGSLISAETALTRPVETILSGPAASVVGAQFLSGMGDVVVSDIGGTTTDIAVLRGGRPILSKDGATVGGYRTMVEAIDVHTVGLGGDSEIRLDDEKELVAGPRRVVPLSLLARDHDFVVPRMEAQLARVWPKPHDGKFALRLRNPEGGPGSLSRNEKAIWEKLAEGPIAMEDLLAQRAPEQPLRRLVDRGLVILSAFTPSDAAHVLGLHQDWSVDAAVLGAALWARSERRPGHAVTKDGKTFAQLVIGLVTLQSGEAIVEAASGDAQRDALASRAARRLLRAALASAEELDPPPPVSYRLTLNRPLVGIGAPAATYYPEIARRLDTELAVPDHADVCNAVGAVAGGVSQTVALLITSPAEGLFRIHAPDGLHDFNALEPAAEKAMELAKGQARTLAIDAGAGEIRLETARDDRVATVAGSYEVFVESTISATAFGRPRIA